MAEEVRRLGEPYQRRSGDRNIEAAGADRRIVNVLAQQSQRDSTGGTALAPYMTDLKYVRGQCRYVQVLFQCG